MFISIVSSIHKGVLFKQGKITTANFLLNNSTLIGDSGSALYTTLNGRQIVLGIASFMLVYMSLFILFANFT